jgi:AcrR family transcriptional regulator
MPPARTHDGTARDRLLRAAAELLDAAEGGEVSTRAICERAGAQAPTLYHHFGSKQGLVDAVITHGFKQFLAERTENGQDDRDPIADIREGWDLHVRYGLENPSFYTLIYGRARPGQPCAVVSEVEAMILKALQPAARTRRLRIAPVLAARQILAASTGVTLALIAQPPEARDLSLSDQVRDAILDGITTPAGTRPKPDHDDASLASAAIALLGSLGQEPVTLSPGESALLHELLTRLSAP